VSNTTNLNALLTNFSHGKNVCKVEELVIPNLKITFKYCSSYIHSFGIEHEHDIALCRLANTEDIIPFIHFDSFSALGYISNSRKYKRHAFINNVYAVITDYYGYITIFENVNKNRKTAKQYILREQSVVALNLQDSHIVIVKLFF